MKKPLKINEIDREQLPAKYINAFRTYSTSDEFMIELAFVDTALSVRKAELENKPVSSLDAEIRGRFIMRPNQVQMLIDTLKVGLDNYNSRKDKEVV